MASLSAPFLPTKSLSEIAEYRLCGAFQDYGHNPSANQWAAIRDLLGHLQQAANGLLAKAVYVSAIPAGTGKSTSIQAFSGALMNSPAYTNTGMLIACNHLTEVEAMATALSGYRDKLCVIAGPRNTNLLAMGGHTEANGAQVVITTQAALRATLRVAGDFDDAIRYHYLGRRRALVCWDEAIAFHRPIVIDGNEVVALAAKMAGQSQDAATALKEWSASLDKAPKGPCSVPDFEGLGINFRKLEEDAGDNDDLVAQAKALGALSGGFAYVARDNRPCSGAVVSQVAELPHSLLPIIVTDASAAEGVHAVGYDQMAAAIRVVRLKEAPKTYCNLSIHIVPLAASRAVFKEKGGSKAKGLLAATVAYIRQAIPDDVLVVTYKKSMTMSRIKEKTVEAALMARLTPEERPRVKVLTWGNHTATNAFQKVGHVVLLGLPYTSKAVSYAASGAALNLSMQTDDEADHPTANQVREMERGMLRDATFQALLRGAARMGVDGDCGFMKAAIFQAPRSGISIEDYRAMFPEASILEDRTQLAARPLKGNAGQLVGLIEEALVAGQTFIQASFLRAAMGGMDRKNFVRLMKSASVVEWLGLKGLLYGPFNGASGVRHQ